MPSLVTWHSALKQDFIWKLLKRTEMLHVLHAEGDWGFARGLHVFPTQNAVEGLCPCACEHA